MANPARRLDGSRPAAAGTPGRVSEEGNSSPTRSEAVGLLPFDNTSNDRLLFNSDHDRECGASRSPRYFFEHQTLDNVSGPSAASEIDLSLQEPGDHTYLNQYRETTNYQDNPSRENGPPPNSELPPRSGLHQHEFLANEGGRLQAHQIPEGSFGTPPPESTESETSGQNPCAARNFSWLPLTLKWPFMLCLSVLSFGLAALVFALTIFSVRNNGLGDEDSSAILFFGWRFSPTLVAVMYSLLLTSLLLDIRRTEPYSRLSREKGASGLASILFSLDQFWWTDLVAALPRNSDGGKTSWPYLLATVGNVLGFLVIVPLSSALMDPASIPISEVTSFNQLDFRPRTQGPMVDDNTYFRVTSSYLLGVSTSAWVTEKYVIAPFWPSNLEDTPFGPTLASQPQEWRGSTTAFQAELVCEPLSLDAVRNASRTYTYESNDMRYDSQVNFTGVRLKSPGGCIVEYDGGHIHQFVTPFDSSLAGGGGWWATLSEIIPENTWKDGENTSLTDSTYEPGSGSGCDRDSIIVIQSPLVWSKASDFSVRAEACRSEFYSANVTASVYNSASSSKVLFDETAFRRDRQSFSLEDLGLPDFQTSFLSLNWNERMRSPDQTSFFLPVAGPLALLAARYKMDAEKLRASSDLVLDAQQLHHRFFAERVQSVMKNLSTTSSRFQGLETRVHSRIRINPAIGIAISTLLLSIMVALPIIFVHSRLTKRPLNLYRDPGSAGSVASIIASKRLETRKVFESADRRSADWLSLELKFKKFSLKRGQLVLLEDGTTYLHGQRTRAWLKRINVWLEKMKAWLRKKTWLKTSDVKDWRPTAVKGWGLSTLFFSIIAVSALIIGLNRVSSSHGLYREAFIQPWKISIGTRHSFSLAPYSIIPTVIAVVIKLWWGALEMVFKRLQPYVSMTAKPRPPFQGLTLSYIASPLIYSAGKAMKNRHWMLALICTGAVLTEIFTVGMSALCHENPRRVSRVTNATRAYELRTVPQYYPYRGKPKSPRVGDSTQAKVIKNVYGNLLTNWIYGATLQLTLSDLKPIWTAEDWSFVPVDLTEFSGIDNSTESGGGISDQSPLSGPLQNITIETPGLRARLQCSPYTEILNQSNWLIRHDLTNISEWNLTNHPRGPNVGYELADSGFVVGPTYLRPADGDYFATFYAREGQLTCCANQTSDGPGRAAVGYWSKLGTRFSSTVTSNVSVMWLVGYPIEGLYQRMNKATGSTTSHWIWSEPPTLTGINCLPLMESADAEVTIDPITSIVQSHNIIGKPRNFTAAWQDRYVKRNRSTGTDAGPSPESIDYIPQGNITVSFGWVFLDALMGSATVSSNVPDPTIGFGGPEDLSDRTFNFRMKGFNLDFMSYSMLNQAQNNVDALSDPSNLARLASNAFSVFFQHFVASNLSDTSASGGWAFQKIGARLPADLGCAVDYLDDPKCRDSPAPPPDQNTNRTASLQVDRRVRSIEFSEIAVWLCVSILAFLGAATILVFWLSRAHFKNLPRDVDTVASVLGFVYGSWGLLEWVRGGGLERAKDRSPLIQLGPFTEADGTQRWGIKIVGSEIEAGADEGFHWGEREQEESQYSNLDEEHAEDCEQAEE